MSGSKAGGIKAHLTNTTRYGKDYYSRIGAMGGKASGTGGFAYGDLGREKARVWGAWRRYEPSWP